MIDRNEFETLVNATYDKLNVAIAVLRSHERLLAEERFQLANETAMAHNGGLIDGKNQQQRDAAERILLLDRLNRVADCEVAVANAKLDVELATNERRRLDALIVIAQL